MSGPRKHRRREERKFRRLLVRYGATRPEHRAEALQISTGGCFLGVNQVVYAVGTAIVVEIKGPAETWVASGVVRHAFKVHPSFARYARPGMGVEFVDAPPALQEFLSKL